MLKKVEFTGILQCKIAPGEVEDPRLKTLIEQLPEEAKVIDGLHVTLVHQHYLKPMKRSIELTANFEPQTGSMWPPFIPEVDLGERIHIVERGKKKAWIVLMRNQFEWRAYVNRCMAMLGLPTNPEPYRVYHITLANLTGKPFDSVGDVDVSDFA
jgi:hypothetical protein